MMAFQPPATAAGRAAARPAVPADREKISNLIFSAAHLHRHLDWRAPLDWLGRAPYWVLEDSDRIVAALACPTDPDSVAWIRLFAFASEVSGRVAWRRLWEPARAQLAEQGGATAAAIAAQGWIAPILNDGDFELVETIVVLVWDQGPPLSVSAPKGVTIRVMTPADLQPVAETDREAFDWLWSNSMDALTRAYAQASYASVAEDGSGVLAYQLSTGGPFGMHLARLAVRPAAQRRGLGTALISDLMLHMNLGGEPRLTVNTQAANAVSLALYEKLGFRLTGERYPVYTARVPGKSLSTDKPAPGNARNGVV